MSVLSIQSHVAYGYAGNRSAAFPLERLGFDVLIINTVQFSNHMGYGSWKGEVFSADHIEQVFRGIEERGVLSDCQAVLSGFMGDAAIGRAILYAAQTVKKANPEAVYCCDPVMGDYDRGITVRPGIKDFLIQKAVPIADIITPNQFEAETLVGFPIRSPSDARKASERLHARGPRIVLITSFKPEGMQPGTVSLFLSEGERAFVLTTPELPLSPPLVGTGDLTAALFLAHYLKTGSPKDALEFAADSVFSVLDRTWRDGCRELRLIQSQEEIAHPRRRFAALPIGKDNRQGIRDADKNDEESFSQDRRSS